MDSIQLWTACHAFTTAETLSMRGLAGVQICGARDPQSQEAHTPTHRAAQGGESAFLVTPMMYSSVDLTWLRAYTLQCSEFMPCVLYGHTHPQGQSPGHTWLQVFLTNNHLAIAMEYAAGGNLYQLVARSGGLPEPDARWYFQQLIFAIDYCHKMVGSLVLVSSNLSTPAPGAAKH